MQRVASVDRVTHEFRLTIHSSGHINPQTVAVGVDKAAPLAARSTTLAAIYSNVKPSESCVLMGS